MIITITSGAHWRNVHLPNLEGELVQFAHRFDPDEPEDVPHQANNFLTYANALGGFTTPHVLIGPPKGDDEIENAHIAVEMSDWAAIVSSATGSKVTIR